MTTEAKVGAFTLVGIAILTAVLLQLQGFSFSTSRNYTIYVGFTQVVGLAPEADVRYAGVLAGKVKAIEPEGTGVRVTLSVHPDIRIPRDARISLAANSVLGDKFVLISPAGSKSTDYLKDGDFVIGADETSVDSVLENVSKAVADVHDLLGSLNDILGNPRMKESVLGSAENVREVTAHIRDLTAVLGRVALQNEGNMHAMMEEMRTICRDDGDGSPDGGGRLRRRRDGRESSLDAAERRQGEREHPAGGGGTARRHGRPCGARRSQGDDPSGARRHREGERHA